MASGIQTALHLIYPPRCTICGDQVESDFGLCGPCWRDTPFISGLVCEACGVPLPGEEDADQVVHCDDCLKIARPWTRGRAALLYRDNGRRLVLALKHGDRHDVVRPAAMWMAQAARVLLVDNMLIAPVPLHWIRMLRRRYNQAALLAEGVANETGLAWCPDLLTRPRRTKSLEGMGLDARFKTLEGAVTAHPKRRHRMAGRHVLLIDDVMTSGATFSAAAQACFASGAKDVSILALARVAKDD
ncbi:Competence protein F homolog, phosphoribosyltransferase domain; protein YhgH required for utilization of DNA as sole source of carbon and energy [hydrothermal vent metagenome]|uniref:Competence protein F homolog, phosphoribosyltransferase domain protein YhgH required for utilization of DNA as sole source of carbon and energy n=1 Tax=hydrothermal vent metagenome TaxID=652676 RepID=A0A3B0SAC4_9ZZZZ